MSKQTGARIAWKCPDCGRAYKLPASRPLPTVCKQCARRNEKAVSGAKSEPPTLEPAEPAATFPLVDSATPERRGERELPHEVESHIARQERERLLADVANISRTMTFFRRLVWAMVIMMLLNFVLVGAAFFYSMKQMSALGGLFDRGAAGAGNGGAQAPAGAGQGAERGLPPGVADQLKPIEDYFGTVDDLLKDIDRR